MASNMVNNEEFDIFISYKWNQYKDSARDLNLRLRNAKGYRTCIDVEQMESGYIDSLMSNGIHNSKLFLCCLSEGYTDDIESNTMKEHRAAAMIRKPIIYVIFDNIDGLSPHEIGLKYCNIWTNFAGQLYFKATDFDGILRAIEVKMQPYATLPNGERRFLM